MKKKIILNEGQYRLLFESDDNPEEKVKRLLASGIEENIEMAFMFMDSQNLDKESILQPYQETFDFLKSSGDFSRKISFGVDAMVAMANIEKLYIMPTRADNIHFLLSLKNLPNLKKVYIWNIDNYRHVKKVDKFNDVEFADILPNISFFQSISI